MLDRRVLTTPLFRSRVRLFCSGCGQNPLVALTLKGPATGTKPQLPGNAPSAAQGHDYRPLSSQRRGPSACFGLSTTCDRTLPYPGTTLPFLWALWVDWSEILPVFRTVDGFSRWLYYDSGRGVVNTHRYSLFILQIFSQDRRQGENCRVTICLGLFQERSPFQRKHSIAQILRG